MTLRKGFTLVEMLVVIAIIAILAAALFPAIQSAIDSAKATAMKNKGRGVWIAVTSANSEREPLGKTALWPALINGSTNSTSSKYFTYLMSDGSVDMAGAPVGLNSEQDRLCSDLKPDMLAGAGVTAASDAATFGTLSAAAGAQNSNPNAWNVFIISDGSQSDAPFMLTRNVTFTSMTGIDSNSVPNFNAGLSPFGEKRAVWVTRGGGCFDARKKYVYGSLLQSTNQYTCIIP